MKVPAGFSRREFLKAGTQAAGFALAFHLPAFPRGARAADTAAPVAFAPNAYLKITPDNQITLWVTRSEMGQGVRTTLPMILAEELAVDLARVRLEQAATVAQFKGIRLRTSGSGSSAGTWNVLRRAGATAREMLITAASESWGVERSTCRAENGTVLHTVTGRRITYGALAEAASKLPVPREAPLKDPAHFRYVGRPKKRMDGPDIVSGRARYGIDVRVPGMLHASVLRCPYLGGRVAHWDGSKAKAVPGVRHVVPVTTGLAQGMAVVADSTWAAQKGRDALRVEWDPGPNLDFDSEAFYRKVHEALPEAHYKVREEGDALAAMEHAAQRIEATYEYPFQAHAPLEPMNCTAHARKDSCEIWAPTQAPERAQELAAKLLGLPVEAVTVNVTLVGGGFGRRLVPDEVPEAVEISRAVGAPVQVLWTRVDDMRYGYFHAPAIQQITCGLDESSKPVAWVHLCAGSDLSVFGPSPGLSNPKAYEEDQSPWGAYDNPYYFPAMKVNFTPAESPVPTGPWRAVEYPGSVFARECFLDELAEALHKDPIQLRLELLAPGDVLTPALRRVDRGRLRKVLEVVAEKSHWSKPITQTDGRRWGRGVACNVYHAGSYIAQVVEVSIGHENDVRVHRVICAVDCGQVINPLGLEGQTESGIAWGLSATLYGQITFQNGGAVESSYADFDVVRMKNAPTIELHIVPSEAPPGGYGEHAVPMVAPAVANAVYAASGVRVRRVPITPKSLRQG